MAEKYLKQVAGVTTEQEALVSSAGAGDAGKIPALDAAGRLDTSMMPTGIGADTKAIPASENLAAGDYVNVWDDAGAFKCRKADATAAGKYADGFILAAVTSGDPATIYFEGENNQVTGQTPGAVFLSATTAGAGTATAPSGSANVVQQVGIATSATSVNFHRHNPIVLATVA